MIDGQEPNTLNTSRHLSPLVKKRLSIFLVALASFFTIDTAVFRSGLYQHFIEPGSSLGVYQFRTNLGMSKISQAADYVAVVGDSRVEDGFSPRIFDAVLASNNCRGLNFGIPASAPRIWYYLLKGMDPRCDAFKEIVIALPTYRDIDEWEDFVDRIYDAHYLMPYLGITDAAELIDSYNDPSLKAQAAMQWLVKSYGMKADIIDFFMRPKTRLANLEHQRQFGESDWYQYEGKPSHLEGITCKNGAWLRGTSNIPEVNLVRLNQRVFTALPGQTGRRQRYNTYWLNKLVDRYASSNTKIVFVKLPNDPVPRQCAVPSDYKTINSLMSKPSAIVLPENYFADLNYPKYFGDEMHLNGTGRKLFTVRLATVIKELLKGNSALASASSTGG